MGRKAKHKIDLQLYLLSGIKLHEQPASKQENEEEA